MSGAPKSGKQESLLKYAVLFLGKSVGPWLRRRVDQARAIQSDVGLHYRRVLGGSLMVLGSMYFIIWYASVRRGATPLVEARPLAALHDDCAGSGVDVIVVGAGVIGASTAYHLAQCSLRVMLVDQHQFPRDKLCGDVLTPSAQRILNDMGVLQRVLHEGCYRWINTRGFISPNGESVLGTVGGPRDIAVQRVRLDECLVTAAEHAGVMLKEQFCVGGVQRDPDAPGLWRVVERGPGGRSLSAPMLVIADGADSGLARALGLARSAPSAMAGRAFVEAGTHTMTNADSVAIYASCLLPGHLSFTRLVDDHLIIRILSLTAEQCSSIHDLFHRVMKSPAVVKLIGPDAVISPLHVATLRVNTIATPYDDHVLVVGDAAGQVDPLSGQGIQYGLEASKIAALTITEGFAAENLSKRTLKRYQSRISKLPWGFSMSALLARLILRFPIFIDAALNVIKRRGSLYLTRWCEALSGNSMWFLQQTPMVLVETIRLKLAQLFQTSH